MKIRSGFVSNSSSSSFVLDKRDLSMEEIKDIKDYNDGPKIFFEHWDITEDDRYVRGYTTMDNGRLRDFMKELGLERAIITWEGE